MKFFSTLFCLLIGSLFTANVDAQKPFTEALMSYNISIDNAKGEKPVASALNGAVLTVWITKDKSKTELVSTPGTETTVFDSKADKGFILKEYSGQKLMITMTEENRADKNHTNSNLKFTTDNSTTTIGSYVCKKAVAMEEGRTYTVYYDPTVALINKDYNNAFPQLPGLPVQYELQSGNLIFKYTLTKYEAATIAPNKFDAPKTGFRVMTYEENQQLKKGE